MRPVDSEQDQRQPNEREPHARHLHFGHAGDEITREARAFEEHQQDEAPDHGPRRAARAADDDRNPDVERHQRQKLIRRDIRDDVRVKRTRQTGEPGTQHEHLHLHTRGILAEGLDRRLVVAHRLNEPAVRAAHKMGDQADGHHVAGDQNSQRSDVGVLADAEKLEQTWDTGQTLDTAGQPFLLLDDQPHRL